MAKVLIAGCGDLGAGLAQSLIGAGHSVTAIRRTGVDFPAGVMGITGDILTLADAQLPAVEIIFLIMTPSGRTEAAYQQAYLATAQRLLQRYREQAVLPKVFFVSSTSVYGQNQGEWLTEADLAVTSSPTASVLLATERYLTAHLPTTCVRFSGIYGPGRGRLLEQVARGEEWSANQWTNRIHRDDCVRLLAFLTQCHLQGQPLDSCYIGTDSTPVSLWEVKLNIAASLGVTPNLPSHGTVADFIPQSGKRLSNQALRSLGFNFLYPSYTLGYAAMIDAYLENNRPLGHESN